MKLFITSKGADDLLVPICNVLKHQNHERCDNELISASGPTTASLPGLGSRSNELLSFSALVELYCSVSAASLMRFLLRIPPVAASHHYIIRNLQYYSGLM